MKKSSLQNFQKRDKNGLIIVVDKLQTDLTNIMEALNNRYGEKKQNTIITKSKRTKGGGYARIGRIFLGGLDQEAYYSNQED